MCGKGSGYGSIGSLASAILDTSSPSVFVFSHPFSSSQEGTFSNGSLCMGIGEMLRKLVLALLPSARAISVSFSAIRLALAFSSWSLANSSSSVSLSISSCFYRISAWRFFAASCSSISSCFFIASSSRSITRFVVVDFQLIDTLLPFEGALLAH